MRKNVVLLFFIAAGLAVAQPSVPTGGIVNGASFVKNVAPGALVSIFGTQLAASPAFPDTIPISTTLGGVTVHFVNGGTTIDAPLLFVGPNQINAQVPWDINPGNKTTNVNVVVSNNGKESAATPVTMEEFSAGIISIGNLAAVQNADGTLAQPAGSIPGRTTHPAAIGDTVVIYTTGLGTVVPAIPDGTIPPPGELINTQHKPSVYFGGITGEVQFSGLSPQFVGVYQLNVVVPNVVPGDAVPLQLVLGGVATSKSITVAISQ
jgi:uncharacterized protein (TIGR03437 family)